MKPDIFTAIAELAASDPFGTVRHAAVAKRAGVDLVALSRAVATLQKHGFVEVDEDTGVLSLTAAGKEQVAGSEPVSPQPVPDAPSMPAMEISTCQSRPEPRKTKPMPGAPAPEPPTVEPAAGQLDLLPPEGRPVRVPAAARAPTRPKRKSALKAKRPT